VFQDHGNLNVTLVMPGPADRPLEAIGELMSVAVADLGLPPMLGDRGLFIGETKLCGFAVFRTKAGLLAHSTLLIATAAERIGKYLTGPPPDPLPLDSHRSPVASLADHGLRSGWRRFRKSCWPPPRGNWAHWKPGSPTGTSGNATEINGVSLSSPALAIPKAV
jgi:lipoate-protein ligase A